MPSCFTLGIAKVSLKILQVRRAAEHDTWGVSLSSAGCCYRWSSESSPLPGSRTPWSLNFLCLTGHQRFGQGREEWTSILEQWLMTLAQWLPYCPYVNSGFLNSRVAFLIRFSLLLLFFNIIMFFLGLSWLVRKIRTIKTLKDLLELHYLRVVLGLKCNGKDPGLWSQMTYFISLLFHFPIIWFWIVLAIYLTSPNLKISHLYNENN